LEEGIIYGCFQIDGLQEGIGISGGLGIKVIALKKYLG
jgi:hypothetical protein